VYQQGKTKIFNPFGWLIAGDFLAIALSFFIASTAYPQNTPSQLEYALYACLLFFGCQYMKLYTWGAFTLPARLLVRLTVILLVSAFCFLVMRYVLFGEHSSDKIVRLVYDVGQQTNRWLAHPSDNNQSMLRGWICLQVASALVLLFLIRRFIFWTAKKFVSRITIERVAFVGWSPKLNVVLRTMARQKGVFLKMAGFFYTTKDSALSAVVHGYSPLGKVSHLEKELQEHGVTTLIVEQTDLSAAKMLQVTEIAARNLVRLEVIHSSFDIFTNYINVRVVGGVPMIGLASQMRHEQPIYKILKRVMDIGCALFGLLVSSPVIAVLAVLIYLESPGPVFYRQIRRGLGGKEFTMLKLRSMKLDADNVPGIGWTVKDDPRRLRIGIFMREWNLDELPQFWNVLKGDMSMVGPRPERPGSVDSFKHTIRYYNLRFACKSGLTGWAAVHGLRGDTSIEDRLTYDLYYIENWSLWLDIKIMFMTLLPPENAY